MKYTAIAAFAALGVALSGCATVVKGSSESVAITTPPTTGADCTLSSSEGTWHVTTPGIATVQRSKHDMQVHCTKTGWNDGVGTIPSNFQGWTLGNLLIGGVIGVGVDAATGAMNEYPHAFQVPMSEKTAAAPASTAAAPASAASAATPSS